MLEDGCIDQKVRWNSFIITTTIENAISSQFTLIYEFYYSWSPLSAKKLHQKLLSKTSTNGNHHVLVLLASSDLESNQLPSTKLVNRM